MQTTCEDPPRQNCQLPRATVALLFLARTAMLQTVATLDLEFRPWVLTGSASLDHGLGAQWSVVASLDLRPKLSGQWSPVKEPPPHGTDSASGHWWASAQLGLELQTGTASWGAGLNWRPLSTERSAHGPNCYCQLAAMRPGAMRFDNILLSKHFKYLLIRLKVTTNPFHCGPRRFGSQSNHKMLIFSPILGHISASGHWHCLYRGAEVL